MATTGRQITVHCSNCGKQYQLSTSARGKSAKCGCGHRFVVEPTGTAQPAPQPAATQPIATATDDTAVVGAPNCVNHGMEPAIDSCLKCSTPICRQCALRTRSGKHLCRPCAKKHAAGPKPLPPASDMLPPNPTTPLPQPESEPIIDAFSVEASPPVPSSPGAISIEEFLRQQRSKTEPQDPFQDDLFQDIAAAPAMPTAPGSGYGNSYAAYQATAQQALCAQHPHSPVAGICMICRKPVCATCSFHFPSNLMCCPECASNTDYPISPHRKIMIYASLGCAVFATLVMAFMCAGLLSFLGDSLIAQVILELIIVLPLCLGIGLGFGSWNKQEGNPALLWAGGIWNSLGLAAWLTLIAFMTLANLAGG